MSNLLEQFLTNVDYNPSTCHDLSHNLAARIMEKIKQLRLRRYKYVTVVSIGSQNERSAMHFGSRCLWDQDVDSFTTVKFTNSSLFAVAMIYGLQFEWWAVEIMHDDNTISVYYRGCKTWIVTAFHINTVSLNDSFELLCISLSVTYITLNK